MYKEEIYKVALSSNDNKRLQTFGKITTFVQETPHVKECKIKWSVCAKKKRH